MTTIDWASKLVGVASEANPLVQPNTVKMFEALLRDRLGDELLKPSELTEVTNELLSTLEQSAEEPEENET